LLKKLTPPDESDVNKAPTPDMAAVTVGAQCAPT